MKSAVMDAPCDNKKGSLPTMSPLAKAVLEWILSLPGRPVVKHCGVDSGRGRSIDEALVLCYTREITKAGLQAFGEVADRVQTFGMLQREMTRKLMTSDIPKPVDRKQLLREKIQHANSVWNAAHSGIPCLSASSSSTLTSSTPTSSPTSEVLTPRSTRKVTFELS
eukprot:TRINITY_DN14184_c0_g1_i1.p1 TRINITY_DN14184_c0_g1~~TRINITY_DN14184_c0_g1_i1.p1  ORF type:complete len:166 (+),score=9.88 TRINITY_DN14184_c0_g1_i1:118-615(+)